MAVTAVAGAEARPIRDCGPEASAGSPCAAHADGDPARLFIAYPFFEGVLLSLTTSRRRRRRVRRPQDFVKIWNDSIFRTTVSEHLLVHGRHTVFKLASRRLWLAMLLNRHSRARRCRAFILLPFIIPTVLSTFSWK